MSRSGSGSDSEAEVAVVATTASPFQAECSTPTPSMSSTRQSSCDTTEQQGNPELAENSCQAHFEEEQEEGEAPAKYGEDTSSASASASGSGGATGSGESLGTVVDRILQKQRNELMFELRRMQHGDRPVTGQGNREAVQHFFDRQLNPDVRASPAEQHEQRPESVVVEVNALVERRPVSSVLQSSGFRRSLESALRGALGSVQHLPMPRRAAAASTQHPNSASSLRDQTLRNEHLRTSSENTSTPHSQTPWSIEREHNAARAEERHRHTHTSPSHPATPEEPTAGSPWQPAQLPQQPGPSRAQAWLQGQPLPADPSEEQQRTAWDTVEQAHRESVISDISELVQRQLVTSALEGQIRGLLEAHVRNRVVESGTNGHQVQEFIRSLPRTTLHQHNDFSDLGIIDAQQQAASLSDDVSIISATAAVSVPYAQSQTALTKELKSLKSQMKELQSLMRMSLEMQMDTQRAIRQEVAAALSQQGVATSPNHPQPRPASDNQCLICLDRGADAVLYQCGHMCVCYTCGLDLRSRGAHCPMCRAPIKDIIQVYKSSLE